MGIVIDIPYGPQLCVPSGDNRKHRISPHDSYFHVHKHVNRQHGTSHDLNFPQSQTTNYKVRTGTSTESSKFGLLAPGRMVAATTNPLEGEKQIHRLNPFGGGMNPPPIPHQRRKSQGRHHEGRGGEGRRHHGGRGGEGP